MAQDCAISRRAFVATSGVLAGLTALGAATAPGIGIADDQSALEEGATEVWGHCAINCPSGCPVKLVVKDGKVLRTEAYANPSTDLDDPQPRACLRGRSYAYWMNHPERLSTPLKRVEGTNRGEGVYERCSWEEAVDLIAQNLRRVIDTYGNQAVYVNLASGVQTATGGSKAVYRLMNLLGGYMAYYGSYSSAQLSWAAPYMWGGTPASTMNAMNDSDLILMFGASLTETGQGGGSYHHDWVCAREKTGAKVHIFDPRMNDTLSGHSEQWEPINPGTDAALVSAIAHELIVNDQCDLDFLHTYCVGFDEETMPESAKGQNKSYTDYIMGTGYDMVEKTPEWAAPITGISADRIREIAEEVAEAEAMFVLQNYGSQRRSNGEMTTLAICMLPILTGNVGLPGTSTGLRQATKSMGVQNLPTGDNPVKAKLPVFLMAEAVDHGAELTERADGIRGVDQLESGIKFMWNYAGNCITNQNSDINRVHDIMVDDTKCEFIVAFDVVMNDSLKYADVILPDLFRLEQDSLKGGGGDDGYLILGTGAPTERGERKTAYEAFTMIAEAMGVGDAYTEGKTEREWIDELYEKSREENPDYPELDEMRAMGVAVKHNDAPTIGCKAFREDPEANPLGTPSGKIEIYSEALDAYIQSHEIAEDDFVAPVPVYAREWYGAETVTDEFPLQLTGFHYRGRVHSSWGNVEVLKEGNPQEVWINPVDAEMRGIAQGDTVRVQNQFGATELLAKVTPRIVPGTVAISQGAWHDADMNGDRVDHGGCINVLTTRRPSPLAKGNPQHTNICQVTKI